MGLSGITGFLVAGGRAVLWPGVLFGEGGELYDFFHSNGTSTEKVMAPALRNLKKINKAEKKHWAQQEAN